MKTCLQILWILGSVIEVTFIAVVLAVLFSLCVAAQSQTVPAEVKQAIAVSLKASNTDGIHEEGGIWGMDTLGKLLVIPAKPGKSHPVCTEGTVTISPGDAADPSLDANLKTIDGQWHVHPRATRQKDTYHLCYFVQPPSKEDIESAMDGEINLVIGAGDGNVYYYSTKGVTGKISYQEFLK